MKTWAMGAICAAMICAPAQAAVRVFEGEGTAYYREVDTTPMPEWIGVTFRAEIEIDRYGSVTRGFYGALLGRFELRSLDGTVLETFTNSADARPDFEIYGNSPNEEVFFGPYAAERSGYHGFARVTAVDGQAVPEPSTWAMLILGFGTLGAALRRRARPSSARAVRRSVVDRVPQARIPA